MSLTAVLYYEETPPVRREIIDVLLYLDKVIKELESVIKLRKDEKVQASNACLALVVTKSKLSDYMAWQATRVERSRRRRKLEAKVRLKAAKTALRVAKALLGANLTLVDLYALNVIDLRKANLIDLSRTNLPTSSRLSTFCGIDLNVSYPF